MTNVEFIIVPAIIYERLLPPGIFLLIIFSE